MASLVVRTAALVLSTARCSALSRLDALGISDEPSADETVQDGGTTADGRPSGNDDGSSSPVTDAAVDPQGIDGSPEAAAPPKGYCAGLMPAPTLCTDFDDAVFPGPWLTRTNGGGSTSLASNGGRSLPAAALLTVSGSGNAYLERTFPTAASTELHIGFNVHPTAITLGGTTTGYELVVVRLGTRGGNPYELQLERADGELNIEEERPASDGTISEDDTKLGIPLALGSWRRIDVRLELGNGSSSLTVEAEGAAPVTKPLSAHLYNVAPTIMIGHNGPSNTIDVRYDDIVVDVR